MVGNIKGILGNINGNNRIILYKYNLYSLTFSQLLLQYFNKYKYCTELIKKISNGGFINDNMKRSEHYSSINPK